LTDRTGSHRQILRSTSIIGGASAVNIVISLVRTKAAAMILGPSGVGLLGLLQSLVGVSAAIAGLGLGNVGTRQIAEAAGREDNETIAAARRALVWGTFALAVVGGLVFWLLRAPLAHLVLGDQRAVPSIGWLALALALTVGAASQTALLNGLRRIGDLARISVLSSFAATIGGVGILLLFGAKGVIAYLLVTPLAAFVLGHIYVSRLPRLVAPATALPQLMRQWGDLVRLGSAFMLASLGGTLSQLFVRSLIEQRLGADQLGWFQAASSISMTYVGFVLGAMGTDYYPRLAGAMSDPASVNRMANEQTEVGLALAGPVFLIVLGFAPLVIKVLYTSRFGEAADILRWQILGDILKMASWPLGFVVLASGHGVKFLLAECVSTVSFALLSWALLPRFGIEATGIAFLLGYALYLPIVYGLARQRTGLSWTRETALQFALIFTLGCMVSLSTRLGSFYSAALGVVSALVLTFDMVRRLGRTMDGAARLAQVLDALGWHRRSSREPTDDGSPPI
jgi:O-antigen/teichoic acid export membrane protein